MRFSRLRDKIEQVDGDTLDIGDSKLSNATPDPANGATPKSRKRASTTVAGNTPKKRKTAPAKPNSPKAKSDIKPEPGLDGTQDVLPTKRQTRGKILTFKHHSHSEDSGIDEDVGIDSDEDYEVVSRKVKSQANTNLPTSPERPVKIGGASKKQAPIDQKEIPLKTEVSPSNGSVRRLEIGPPKKTAAQLVQKTSSLRPADQPIPSIEVSPPPSPQLQLQANIPMSTFSNSSDFESDVDINTFKPGTTFSFPAKRSELDGQVSDHSVQIPRAFQDGDATNAQVGRNECQRQVAQQDAPMSPRNGELSDTLNTFEVFTNKFCLQVRRSCSVSRAS